MTTNWITISIEVTGDELALLRERAFLGGFRFERSNAQCKGNVTGLIRQTLFDAGLLQKGANMGAMTKQQIAAVALFKRHDVSFPDRDSLKAGEPWAVCNECGMTWQPDVDPDTGTGLVSKSWKCPNGCNTS